MLVANKDFCLDLLINTCDLFIPAVALGYVPAPQWFADLMGVVSSAAYIFRMIRPGYSITPSP